MGLLPNRGPQVSAARLSPQALAGGADSEVGPRNTHVQLVLGKRRGADRQRRAGELVHTRYRGFGIHLKSQRAFLDGTGRTLRETSSKTPKVPIEPTIKRDRS